MKKKSIQYIHTVKRKLHSMFKWWGTFRHTGGFRIIVIGLFLGLNIALFPQFLRTNRLMVPEVVAQFFSLFGVEVSSDIPLTEYTSRIQDGDSGKKPPFQPSLEPAILTEKLNQERVAQEVPELIYSSKLSLAAVELLEEASKTEYELEQKEFITQLRSAMQSADYNYSKVSHNMVVGPLIEDGVIDAWYSDEAQRKAVVNPDFTEVGFATRIIEPELGLKLGVVVQLLARPQQKNAESPLKVAVTIDTDSKPAPTPVFPYISGYDVFTALNTYRQSHGRPQLTEHSALCEYAEKRVKDLVAHGGLDAHAGFSKDFSDLNNLPESIKKYPGKTIAENLAYQHCKNMTTGDSFVAQNATALIEWCFDSSTAGHREAQLNPNLSSVCVRTDRQYFVVIFGD